jgi:hypothetical protein
MLQKPQPNHRGIELLTTWFQQDGATAHTVRTSMKVILEKFLKHAISLRSKFPWAAHSPDLSVCDYLFWGVLQSESVLHWTMEHRWPQDCNSEANFSNTRKHGGTSTGNLQARLEKCEHNDGQHLRDMLFKMK